MAQSKNQNSKLKIKTHLLRALILAFCLWVVVVLVGRALQLLAVRQIAELTNARVEAESVHFRLNGSIFIRNLVIGSAPERKYDNAVFKAETVYTRFGIGSLLLFRPRLKKISVRDFLFSAQCDLDTGRWNITEIKIKTPKGRSGSMPVIHLKRGTLQYATVSNNKLKVVSEVPLGMKFEPAKEDGDGYAFYITTADRPGFAKSTLTGLWQSTKAKIEGTVSSEDIPAFERSWTTDAITAELNYDPNNEYSLNLEIKNLSSEQKTIRNTIAFGTQEFLQTWNPLNSIRIFFSRYYPAGNADIELQANGNLDRLSETKLTGKVYCKDASISHYRFPYTIQNIAGSIDFTERTLTLNNLTGLHNDVKFFFNGVSEGFGPDRTHQIRITSDRAILDQDVYYSLNEKQKKFWTDFAPKGFVAVDYRYNRNPRTGRKITLALEPLAAEVTYRHFPYPLKNLTGSLLFEPDRITISDVISQTSNRRVIFNGEVTDCRTDDPLYDISVKAENIPLDSTLASALAVVQKSPGNGIDTAGQIQIDELTGRIWKTREYQQPHYDLSPYTKDLQLNEHLFAMLSPAMQKAVRQVQPTGRINCRLNLKDNQPKQRADYKITVDCLDNAVSFKSFPYPLKNITGQLTITRDEIEFADITAFAPGAIQIIPGASTVKIDGRITKVDNAFDSGEFELSACDISLDSRLGAALPKAFKTFYTALSPAGRFDLDIENIKIFDAEPTGKNISFAAATRFKNCLLDTSPAVTELDAAVKIKALYNTDDGFQNAAVAFNADNLKIKDKPLTGLKADIDYDPNLQNWLTKNLIADCCGGKLMGTFELKRPFETTLEYMLQMGFEGIDLKQFLVSSAKPQQSPRDGHTTGRMNGALNITAQLGNNKTRFGTCRLTIENMQVGKLSPLAKLMHVLKLTSPKDFAFDSMFIDSYIKADNLFFERFDMSGETLAFNGSGKMNLKEWVVELLLTARGSRLVTAEPSALQALAEGLGRGVVQMEVTGNANDPQVTVRTLPAIKESLKILGTKKNETN